MRYFFDIAINSVIAKDDSGLTFDREQDARAEARRALAEIAAEEIPSSDLDTTIDLWLRTETLAQLGHFQLTFRADQ
jgi:hypothetical protein